jgi:hypothetical protein
MSVVAGILDGFGGWHVVVSSRKGLRHHVRPGQILCVVPGFRINEPVPWNDIPMVISRAEAAILEYVRTRNDPDDLRHPAVALFLLRRQRTFHRESVNLHDIVET